jgi:N-methylhydantoinase A
MSENRLFVGADIGGTFTDLVIVDAISGRVSNVKTNTTPQDPAQGVMSALREGLELTHARPQDIHRFVHATTLATNLVIERNGARVAFIATTGFGDMFEISRQYPSGPDRFNLRWERAPALVDRALTIEVNERVGPRGETWRALDTEDARRKLERLAVYRPEAFAVCLLHAYANPAHEKVLGELLAERFPDAQVYLSSQVWPEFREYERACATVLSAYVGPTLSVYAAQLERALKELGVTAELQIMQSSGCIMSVAEASRRPVYAIESGPAAGVMAAASVGRGSRRPDVISFDMGGTTAKAGLVLGGRPRIAQEFRVGGHASATGQRQAGEPVRIPVIDLAEVGAGGGSIAWVDAGRHLRLGPRSAGADPGPACYQRGGMDATVTDADLILGYLDEHYFNGGKMRISRQAASAAIEKNVAGPLGISVVDGARGIHSLANTMMGAAIRIVTLQRGVDPRDHAIVAFGGAGPVHIVHLAELFGIREVLVPPSPGVKSAYGLLISDIAYDTVKTLMMPIDGADLDALKNAFDELENRAEMALAAEIRTGGPIVMERLVDVGFAHKAETSSVTLFGRTLDAAALKSAEKNFRDSQRRIFGVESSDSCRMTGVRVHAYVPVEVPRSNGGGKVSGAVASAIKGRREAWFAAARGFTDTPIYDRARIGAGHRIEGPAIIEEADATTICPPGYRAVADDDLNLIITVSKQDAADRAEASK